MARTTRGPEARDGGLATEMAAAALAAAVVAALVVLAVPAADAGV